MSQQIVNPYPDLGQQYSAGLASIIAGLPTSPQISDLVTQVYDYFISHWTELFLNLFINTRAMPINTANYIEGDGIKVRLFI